MDTSFSSSTVDTDETAQAAFAAALKSADSEPEVFAALYALSSEVAPARLWTVMTVDMDAGLARRAFSNMPKAYPTSGVKPIVRNTWFTIVHDRHEIFVANTLDAIAEVFPDYELIGSLGCASVMNLPVILDGELVATINLLDGEGYFSSQRVATYQDKLASPAMAAIKAARQLNG